MKKIIHNKSFKRLFAAIIIILIIGAAVIIIRKSGTALDSDAAAAGNSDLPAASDVTGTIRQPAAADISTAITPTAVPVSQEQNISVIEENSDYLLYSIDFLDNKYGWAIRYEYNSSSENEITKLVSTQDGGIHWKEFEAKDAILRKITFADKDNGWAIAQTGNKTVNTNENAEYEILGTKDGGLNWTVQQKQEVTVSESIDIEFQSITHGYAILCGTMYVTDDQGENWTKVTFPVENFEAQHQSFINEATGWVVGTVSKIDREGDTIQSSKYTLYIFKTSDGGKSWSKEFSQTYENQTVSGIDICFVNSTTGWFLTSNLDTWEGDLYYTSDSGKSWKAVNQIKSIRPAPQELEFITPEKGFIPLDVGAGPIDGGLLYTEDAGKTFSQLGGDYGIYSLNSVAFVSEQEGWAAGENLSSGDYIVHTTDGGKTWSQIYPSPMPTMDMSFIDNQNGYGLGMLTDQKAILKTSDGGSSWQCIYSFPDNCIPKNISFADQNTGWVIAQNTEGNEIVLKTLDGGNTWTKLDSKLSIDQYYNPAYFRFINGTDGIIIVNSTDFIKYYRTTDGGMNWTETDEPGDPTVVNYQFCFASLYDGWKIATLNNQTVKTYYCTDGSDWQPASGIDLKLWSYGAEFSTKEKGWLLAWNQSNSSGVYFKLMRTENAGKDWTVYSFPKGVDLESLQNQTPMQFTDDLHGWILSRNGLLRTEDGGKTWSWMK